MNKVKLTKTAVERLSPSPGKQVVTWDKDLTGFGVRVSPGGSRTYFYQGRIKGHSAAKKITIGKHGPVTAEQARKEAHRLASEMALGRNPTPPKIRPDKTTSSTFGDLMEAYIDMLQKQGKASARLVENAIRKDIERAFPKLWKKPAAEIDIDDCLAIVGKLHDEGSARQADKLRSYIKTAFSKAINARRNVNAPRAMRELKLSRNPAAEIEKVEGSASAADRALSIAEFRAYWKHAQDLPEPRRSLVMLHILTGGQRMQQLARVKLADIDRDALLMRMSDSKGRRTKPRIYSVPLLPEALDLIDNITGAGEYVFSWDGGKSPMHQSYLSDAAKEICGKMQEAGELEGEPFTGKAIRATIETRLMKKPYRVSSDVLARLLSHGLGGVQAKHYAHDSMHEEQVEALEKLWRLLNDAPEPGQQLAEVVKLEARG